VSCPANPPPPAGYQILRGSVPTPVTQWAIDLLHHINAHPLGTTWGIDYNGRTLIARSDSHTWTYRGGQLVTGLCIRGITIYEPIPAATGAGAALAANDLTTPDPTAAVYSEEGGGPNWGLVLASGSVAIGVFFLFRLALEYAGER
jgi:hypothetical protein